MEVVEGPDYIEICYGAEYGDVVNDKIVVTASLHYLGCHYSDKFFG